MSEVEAALTKWISKVKMLESQFGEKVGDKMKIAIMTSMLPLVIQDFVYQNVTREDRRVGRKSCRHEREGHATPMDIGRLGGMTTTRARSTWMPLVLGRGAIGATVGGTSHGTARAKAKVSRISARAAARGTTTATATSKADTRERARTTSTRATAREVRDRRAAARVTRELVGGSARWDTRPTSARSRSRRLRR